MGDKKFEEMVSNERKPPILWVDAKYFKHTMPEKAGHFTQVIRKNDVEARLILLAEVINEPISDNAKMQKPILIEERKRIIGLIEKYFSSISDITLRKKD